MPEPYDKASKLPGGIALAALLTSDEQCGVHDCDSWKTIAVDIISASDDIESDDDEAVILRYPICLKHLPEFIDDMILKAPGNLLDFDEDEDCGDPDCPIHGYLHEDEDDDDE